MYFDRKKIISILIICMLLSSFGGCNKPKPPRLSLSEDSWYYGEVKPDEKVTHLFKLKNEGESKLVIESVYSSCGCISFELDSNEISPGKETILSATFDPQGYEGYVDKTLIIKSNDLEHPERNIDLTITVLKVPHPEIELSQNTFDLGTINTSEQSILIFTISNIGDMNLIIEEIIGEEIFHHNISLPLEILPGEQFPIEIYLDSNRMTEGLFRKAVRIMSNDPNNSITFLRITGTIE